MVLNMRKLASLPLPSKRAMQKLGADIRSARRRRRLPSELLAERARISKATMVKVEKGDPSVALGIYASVLFVLNATDRLADLVDAKYDFDGRVTEDEHLPERIHTPKSRRGEDDLK